MKDLKITGKDDPSIQWLEDGENHGLNEHSASDAIKVIIKKHNALIDRLAQAKPE